MRVLALVVCAKATRVRRVERRASLENVRPAVVTTFGPGGRRERLMRLKRLHRVDRERRRRVHLQQIRLQIFIQHDVEPEDLKGPFHTSEHRGGVERRQLELKGVEGGD